MDKNRKDKAMDLFTVMAQLTGPQLEKVSDIAYGMTLANELHSKEVAGNGERK